MKRAHFTLPVHRAALVNLCDGGQILLTDPEGGLVVHLVIFNKSDTREYFSRIMTISETMSLRPSTGDVLYSNFDVPLLYIVNDIVGKNDILLPMKQLNDYGKDPLTLIKDLLRRIMIPREALYNSFNIFMNVEIGLDKSLTLLPSASYPGSQVSLSARKEISMAICAITQEEPTARHKLQVEYEYR